jgi:uncharacterized membrane protein
VIVKVSTVVVRSGTATFRTTAFLNPMASAVDRTIAYAIAGDTSLAANVAALAAARSRAVSTYVAISI